METIVKDGLMQMASVIIDLTFPEKNNETKKKYKKFNLELTNREYASRLGCYRFRDKKIQISGIGKECRHDILITFLHELSHHIEMIDLKKTGHQKTFYEIHKRLLYTAIDLELLKLEDITQNTTTTAGNRNKLAKLMKEYKKKGFMILEDYMNTAFLKYLPENPTVEKTFKVKCEPNERFLLKKNGYKWNNKETVWEKTVETKGEFTKEQYFLRKCGYINVKLDNDTYYTKIIKVCITGKTYENKENLAKYGYRYSAGKWLKNISVDVINQEIAKVRKLKGLKIHYEF